MTTPEQRAQMDLLRKLTKAHAESFGEMRSWRGASSRWSSRTGCFTGVRRVRPEEGACGDARGVRTTPYANGRLLARRLVESGDGRDLYGFTVAGGVVKAGQIYGSTDEFGFKAVDEQASIHDLHATVLRLMGLDHEKLTYRYAGRGSRLTDVYGNVVGDLVA